MLEEGKLQNFVDWTKLKIRIHCSNKKLFPRARQIWWVSLGQNVGVEINGKSETFERPVLILRRFNDDSCLVLPISSKIKKGNYYFEFVNNNGDVNIINYSQIRTVSTKRMIRMVGVLDEEIFNKIKQNFKVLI